MNQFELQVGFGDLVHISPEFHEISRLAVRVADSGLGVFISSEPGNGTWQLASLIHSQSVRRTHPIRLFRPDRISPALQRRHLFGFEENGEYIAGLLETTAGGTLVIDPVEKLVPEVQSMLFRALNTREFSPDQSDVMVRLDVRFISVSRYLPAEITRLGSIRDELLYRLEGVPLELPALRFRVRDVIPQMNRFIRLVADSAGLHTPSVSRAAAESVVAYFWPGNSEELYQILERAVLLSDGLEIKSSHLTSPLSGQQIGAQLAPADLFNMEADRLVSLAEARDLLFRKAMKQSDNRVVEAARLLKIGRATAFRLARKLGIQSHE